MTTTPTNALPHGSRPDSGSSSARPAPRPYTDLREFIADLETVGELARIRTEVDPILGGVGWILVLFRLGFYPSEASERPADPGPDRITSLPRP